VVAAAAVDAVVVDAVVVDADGAVAVEADADADDRRWTEDR